MRESLFCNNYIIDIDLHIKNKEYMLQYYDIINELYKLTNTKDIRIDNIDEFLIKTIKMLLLIAKTRIIPKYVITQKILCFYLI